MTTPPSSRASADSRLLEGSEYRDDDGAPDVALTAALEAYEIEGRPEPVLVALGGARVLVPVVAVLGESEVGDDGLARDKSSDMAAVLMRGRSGRAALLAFTGTASLTRWDPEARPVPASVRTAATAAVQDGAEALLLDVAGPVRYAVEGDDLVRLAAGWVPAFVDGDAVWLGPPAD